MQTKRIAFWSTLLIGLALLIASCANATAIVTCEPGKEACGDVCIDVQADTENCGKCGLVCSAGQACDKGVCSQDCPASNTKCARDGGAATCVNAKTDNANCGACGKACKSGEVCNGGFCTGTCGDSTSGQTLCGGDAAAPYCANLKADGSNCGKCGASCKSDEVCASGVCQSFCTTDQTRCGGGDGGAGYCASVQTDNSNCGACGVRCAAMETCTAGACTPVCGPNQLQCGGDAGAPYCVDGQTDNMNCGQCGAACPAGKFCSAGACKNSTVQACLSGNDLETNDPWVVCRADSSSAWLSHNNPGGGHYHSLQICQKLGYTKVGKIGGTCSDVCGYCQGAKETCNAPGNETYDGGGSCGSDQFGPILCQTVTWQCLP